MRQEYLIYPKQYHFFKEKVIRNKCFFVMPFDNSFDLVYGTLRKDLTDAGYICSRVDEVPKSIPIISKILKEIAESQFIIVDITNGNANVFYELGISHSFKDAQNILLIKRKDSKVAFDVLHLTYFEYENDNLKYLSSVIKNNLKDAGFLYDFYSIIEEKNIIPSTVSNRLEIIEDIKYLLGEDLNLVTNLLTYNVEEEESKLDTLLNKLEFKIKNYCSEASDVKISCMCNVLFELLLALNKRQCVNRHLEYLLGDYFLQANLSVSQIISLKTDLTIKFAKANNQLSIIMPWIVQYFRRSKSATIDLNRYKLESFMLITTNEEINKIISNAVRDKDCHIREHFSDIIGEKKLIAANEILKIQLLEEKNYFTATSMIEALGKLKQVNSEIVIEKWLNNNVEEIIKTKQYFVFKHVYIAYKNLNTDFAERFYSIYSKYMQDFFM